MPDQFTLEMFSEHVNSKFTMHYGDGQKIEMQLVSAKDVGSSPRQAQFSLVFQGDVPMPVFQGMYRLEHEKLGMLDLFLVPIGKDQNGVQFEAIFNYMIE